MLKYVIKAPIQPRLGQELQKVFVKKMTRTFSCDYHGSTFCVETVKYLDFNRYIYLSRWSRDIASDCDARGPVLDSPLARIFMFAFFVFLVVVFLLFGPRHIICHESLQLPVVAILFI